VRQLEHNSFLFLAITGEYPTWRFQKGQTENSKGRLIEALTLKI
jgi:hypothetical protein